MSPREKIARDVDPPAPAHIDRDTIEHQFRAIQGDVDEVASEAVNYVLIIGAVTAVAVIGVAFWLGKRRGKRRGTVIEVRRS